MEKFKVFKELKIEKVIKPIKIFYK